MDYQIDTNDISRFNLLKVQELIEQCRKDLRNPEIDSIIKDELENDLIYLTDTRNYIMDMRKQQSE